jgi:uncharacterized membrane protein
MLTRRSFPNVFMVIGLIVTVGLAILSPLGLAGIAHFRGDWAQLSNIGQTYGAVSAVLSALALGGILASLLYQARDSRNSHEQMTRTFQFELVKMELEDPSLIAATGAPWGVDIPCDAASLREFLYVQLWVSYMAGIFATRELSASTARQWATLELFHGMAGRTYWAAVGARQIANSKGRYNQFFRLLDDEYKKAISSRPVAGPIRLGVVSASPRGALGIHKKPIGGACVVIIAAIIAVLSGRALRSPKCATDC